MFGNSCKGAAWGRRSATGSHRWLAVGLLALLAACGGGGGGGGGGGSGGGTAPVAPPVDPGVAGEPYFRFSLGDRWRSTDGPITRTSRIVRSDAAGQLIQEKASDASEREFVLSLDALGVWYEATRGADAISAALGRYRIARFPLRVGETFTSIDRSINGVLDLDGDGRFDDLQVVARVTVVGFETVEVPAGRFENVLRKRTEMTQTARFSGSGRTASVTGVSDEWYAPGVGPIRSTGRVESGSTVQTLEILLREYRVGALGTDLVAPQLVAQTPAPDTLGAQARISLSFNEALEADSVPRSAIEVRRADGSVVPGDSVLDADGRTLRFVPSGAGPAGPGTFGHGRHTVRLLAAPEDWSGNRFAGSVQFGFDIDATQPVLVAQSLSDGARDVPLSPVFTFTFNEELESNLAAGPDPAFRATLSGARPEDVRAEVQGRVLTVTTLSPLSPGAAYGLSVDVSDRFGNRSIPVRVGFVTEPGRFAFPVVPGLFAGQAVTSLERADVDGDGRPDVLARVVPDGSAGPGRTLLLRGRPDHGLPDAGIEIAGLGCAYGRALVVDVDADGRLDVLSSGTNCPLQWVRQRPDGGFDAPVVLADRASTAVAVSMSVSGGGTARPALAFVDDAGTVRLLRPVGERGFEAPTLVYLPPQPFWSVQGLRSARLDDDDRGDLVIETRNAFTEIRVLMLARQRADGALEMVQQLELGTRQRLLAVLDATGDGRSDILVDDGWSSTDLLIHRQRPDGSLPTLPERVALIDKPVDAISGDIDGDGRQDVIVAVAYTGGVDNLVQLRPGAAGGFTTLLLVEYAPRGGRTFSPGPISVGDVTGDGRPDLLVGSSLIAARKAFVAPQSSLPNNLAERLGARLRAASP